MKCVCEVIVMAKQRIFILIGLVLVILAFAIFLWRGTETAFGDFIFSNAVTPALLFFVFFGALAGVMKFFVDATLATRMPKPDRSGWERTRAKGKLSYVLNALLFCGLPIIVMLTIQVADIELTSYIVRNFVVLGLVLLGGVATIAAALWNHQEKIYLTSQDSESNINEAVEDRAKAGKS